MRETRTTCERGVVAMITIVIIGALILALGVSASLIGQTEIVLSGQVDREYAARSLAVSCVEEAMLRLKLNSAYAGGTVPIGASSTCTVSVSGSGSTRTLTASASSAEFTKSVVVSASLRQNAALNSHAWHIDAWSEGDPP